MKLRDLANELGLSPTTVSRALNDYPEVSDRTRRLVKRAATRWGYRPSATARGLAVGRIGVTAVIVPKEPASYFDPDITEFLAGIAEVLGGVGQDILLIQSAPASGLDVCKDVIESGRADAIVICHPRSDDERIRFLAEANFPFVVYGKSRTPVPHTWVDIDHRQAGFRSAMYLFESGHQKIGAIEGPGQFAFVEERIAGLTSAFDQFAARVDPNCIVKDTFSDRAGYEHTRRLLNDASPPTAFVYGSLLSTIGGIRAIRELDAEDSTAVVTHDNAVPYLNARNILCEVTVTSFSIYAVAQRVAQHAIRMMDRNAAIETELWEPQLISVGEP